MEQWVYSEPEPQPQIALIFLITLRPPIVLILYHFAFIIDFPNVIPY
jgi:hypothetical protein